MFYEEPRKETREGFALAVVLSGKISRGNLPKVLSSKKLFKNKKLIVIASHSRLMYWNLQNIHLNAGYDPPGRGYARPPSSPAVERGFVI